MKLLNFFRRNISLLEGPARGFLSNYLTILTSFRELIENKNYLPEKIFVSPKMFSLYGNPENWFVGDKISSKGKKRKAILNHNLSAWPDKEQLNLNQYRKFFPYNNRIESFLNKNLKEFSNTLGVHYRGTDHYHTDRVDLSVYLKAISQQLETGEFEQIYLATDEDGIIEKIGDFLWLNHKFDKVIFNNSIKSAGSIGIHLADHDKETKILLGDQVLLDSHSLSKCQTVICKSSNIINYARVLNPELKTLYQDLSSEFYSSPPIKN